MPLTPSAADAAALNARTQRQQRQLARMQRLATALLCVALAVLLFSARFESTWPWLRWVRAFAEASAIGAIADWYAVVALFGRPLGLPIPHTAIIPENQQRIGESLGEFVVQYLLTPENIVGTLKRQDTAHLAAAWLAAPANANRIAAAILNSAPGVLRAPDDAAISRFCSEHLAPKLLEIDVARWLATAMESVVDAGVYRIALDGGLQAFDRWLSANEDLIRAKFAEASKYTPAAFDTYIVAKFLDAIRSLLHDITMDPAHPLRTELDLALTALIRELYESPVYRDAVRTWTRQLIERCTREGDIRRLRETIASYIEADRAREDSVLQRSTVALIVGLSRALLRDRTLLDRLQGAWLRWVHAITLRYRDPISQLVSDVLKSWDADELSRKLALEIGKDLQFIRINGALVGGLVGVALHALTLAVG